MKTILLLSNLDWLPGNDLWWIIAAGLLATMLAFLVGVRVFTAPRQKPAAKDVPQEPHDPFAVGGRTERRGANRRKGSSIGVLITDADRKGPEREGWVLDRSLGGLGLFSDNEVAPGTQLRVQPENAPPMMPWVEVEVKECKPYETGYQLNCAFVKPPPYAVLLLFG